MTAQPQDFPEARTPPQPTGRAPLGTPVPQAILGALSMVNAPAGSDLRPSIAPASSRNRSTVATNPPTASKAAAPSIGLPTPWGLLSLLAETLDDLERTRIAAENRARSLAQVYGLDGEPPHTQAVALVEALHAIEHGAELQLKRALRQHPLGPWVKRTVGVGEKQGARLLAAVGDPYWNGLHHRPRTVSELWAYCGYHVLPASHTRSDTPGTTAGWVDGFSDTDQSVTNAHSGCVGVAVSRRRGERANWSATAKMRAYLIAESCIKRDCEYRAVYDDGRYRYADATHTADCARCGPKGKPALAGSPLSDGHKHARALRLVAKELLKDLWREARALHEGASA